MHIVPSQTQNEPIRVALAIIVRKMNGYEVLVSQRPGDVVRPGAWEFPGGKIEPGEQAAGAAIREVYEELGIRIAITKQLRSHTHSYKHATVVLQPFLARLDPAHQQPQLLQVAAVRWIDPALLPIPGFLEGNRPVLKDMIEAIADLNESTYRTPYAGARDGD